MSSKRAEVLDFTAPFMSNPLKVLLRRGVLSDSPATSAMLAPFTWDAWLLLLLSFVLSGVALWLVARLSPWERDNSKETAVGTVQGSLWHLFASFFRGSDWSPRAWSSKLVLGSWWVFALLVAFLYFATFHARLDSAAGAGAGGSDVAQLLSDPDFKFAVVRGGSTNGLLANSADPVHQRIFERIDGDAGLVSSNRELMEMVLNGTGGVGAVMEGSSADYFTRSRCSLVGVGSLNTRQYAMGFRPGN